MKNAYLNAKIQHLVELQERAQGVREVLESTINTRNDLTEKEREQYLAALKEL